MLQENSYDLIKTFVTLTFEIEGVSGVWCVTFEIEGLSSVWHLRLKACLVSDILDWKAVSGVWHFRLKGCVWHFNYIQSILFSWIIVAVYYISIKMFGVCVGVS